MIPSVNLSNIRAKARLAEQASDKLNHTLAAQLYREAAGEAAALWWVSIAHEYADKSRFASNRAMNDSPHV